MSQTEHRGSCLCGAVSYRLQGELGPITLCHCQRCRKVNGSAFLAASPIRTTDFELLTGVEQLAEYESSPGVYRVFCRVCASPLYSRRSASPQLLRLRIGGLNTPVSGHPTEHIFVASKAEWYDIQDQVPQYLQRP